MLPVTVGTGISIPVIAHVLAENTTHVVQFIFIVRVQSFMFPLNVFMFQLNVFMLPLNMLNCQLVAKFAGFVKQTILFQLFTQRFVSVPVISVQVKLLMMILLNSQLK